MRVPRTRSLPGLLSAGNTANYQAVIVTTGAPFAQLATLNQFEATFGILQLTVTGDTPNPAVSRGLNGVAGVYGDQSGQTGQLTATGLQAFPYLKGPVPMDPLSFGFSAVPNPAAFTTLVSGPGGGAYLGIYTDPIDLRQEMVFTVSSNENQIENQLLRHGMVSWVTRGVYLGTQRNYLTLNIDDIFAPTRSGTRARTRRPLRTRPRSATRCRRYFRRPTASRFA